MYYKDGNLYTNLEFDQIPVTDRVGYEEVIVPIRPDFTILQEAIPNGTIITEQGRTLGWLVQDKYSDYLDTNNVLVTKASQETAVLTEQAIIQMEHLKQDIIIAVQEYLDVYARANGYDNILSACSYAPSTIPKFANEAKACIDARDNAWSVCYQILGEAQAGIRPIPTLAEAVALLPVLNWG